MRLATLIMGLLIGLFFILFGFMELVFSSPGPEDPEFQSAAPAFWIGLFTWLIAVGFVMPFPLVSVISFGIAGFVLVPHTGTYAFLGLWGMVSFIFAVTSLVGWIGKRRALKGERVERDRQLEQHARYEALLRERRTEGLSIVCESCGEQNDPKNRFCAACGHSIAAAQSA